MEMLTPQVFRRLVETTDAWCITLLMPTHPTGRDIKQDPIRFKNLLEQAETLLIDRGQRPADARGRLDPLRQLIHDTSFWADRREGLALFCLPKETFIYAVPIHLSEQIVIGHSPYLVPLIPLITEDTRFYILALSPKQVRLLEATRHTVREVELPGWPENFKQLAAFIEEEPQIQFHTKAAPYGGVRGGRAAVFHGQGGGADSSVHKQRLQEYCRLIDDRVQKTIGENTAPLILACDERLAAIYRNASDYTSIVEQPIAGNPNILQDDELCMKAWQIIKPHIEKSHDLAVANYYEATINGRAADKLETVLPAAADGRVATLLLAAEEKAWGSYNSELHEVNVHVKPMVDDEELLNSAMIAAYRQGASLYLLPKERMPDHKSAVAMLRY